MSAARGFTLVEIMVALGVFAIVSVAVYGRIGEVLQQTQGLETRTLATWVAQNRMSALALEVRGPTDPVPTGQRTDVVTLAGRSWRVQVELSATSDPELRRVEISVQPGDLATDVETTADGANLVGFVGRY